jgi:hypothetical protein
MHARRFACLVLGIWLGGIVLMDWIAFQNLAAADNLLQQDLVAKVRAAPLGVSAPPLVRHIAAELNRTNFHRWENLQLGLGTLFFLVMLFGSREHLWLLATLLLMVVLAALQRFVVSPEWTAQGRLLDFLPADQAGPVRNQFQVIQTGYLAIDGAKSLFCLVLAGQMIASRRGSGRSRYSRHQVDAVDKSDYRGVNW